MIPIAFVTMVESMVMQLPPVDLVVVGIVIAAVSLAVSVYTFYISHTRTLRSEQTNTSRYLWERINEKYDPIVEINRS
jgi:uncharacterized membrane protein